MPTVARTIRPAPEFLAACDRLGMLVMDENRNFNVSPEYVRQLEWMVRRDRNHPSIILWSVFNEEPMQATEVGYEMVRRMKAVVDRLDTTRPVTAAMSGGAGAPINVSQAVDVVGFNYQQGSYDSFHLSHPDLPITSSEDTSSFMTRGVYQSDNKLAMADSYDDSYPGWGATHRETWKTIVERPFIAGGFVWTGFDYRGEPQKFSWPSVSSVFGCMDTCGFPKSAFYMHQAAWIEDKPVLQLIPHWNWPGKEGQPIKVMALTNADHVELFLNGKSLGAKPVDKLEGGEWQVPYEPGKLEAVATKNGQAYAHASVETTGEPVALKMIPDRPALAGDGADAQPITICAVDAQGREVPTAHPLVTLALDGPGAIIGHGNGDNTSHESEKGNQRSLFNGLAQVIVQSQRGGAGSIVLRASAEGLRPAEIKIAVEAVAPLPAVPPTDPIFALSKWRHSPTAQEKPDPNQTIGATDMNTWANFQPGSAQSYEGGAWMAYRVPFTPVANVQKGGGKISFRQITGTAEVWLDGKLAGQKTDPEPAALVVDLPPKEGARSLTVLVNSGGKPKAGLSGLVVVTGN